MQNSGFKSSKAFKVINTLDYLPNSIVIRSILKKPTGNITVVAFDAGEIMVNKISAFDTFLQVIDGNAEIIIDDYSNLLEAGQSIIIPSHASNTLKANVRFKMISTIIKSGYEEISL